MSYISIGCSPRDRGSKRFVCPNGDEASRRGGLHLLLVDDDRPARYSIWALLRWKPDIRVIDTAESGVEALTLVKRRRPDVCLVSATLGQGEGPSVAFRMKRVTDPPRVLIFADAIETRLAGAAIVAGADGVLWRYADPDQQVGVIRRAAVGEPYLPNLRSNELLALLGCVESRDRAIVAMLVERAPSDEIARALGISARELKLRRKRILRRLGHTCRTNHGRQDHTSTARRSRQHDTKVANSFLRIWSACVGPSSVGPTLGPVVALARSVGSRAAHDPVSAHAPPNLPATRARAAGPAAAC